MKICAAAFLLGLWISQASAQSENATCEVKRSEFVKGDVASATMVMVNDGKPCELVFRFGGQNSPDSWELVTPPQSGKVQFKEAAAEYQPNPQFTGTDKFVVAVFGRTPSGKSGKRHDVRNGRFEVTVTVNPKP